MSLPRKHFIERTAFNRGYRVSEDGMTVVNARNEPIKLRNRRGYFRFTVTAESGAAKPCPVHRLQAYQKFGEKIYEPGIQVRHLDGNERNNSAQNIELGTASQNMMDRPVEKRRRIAGMANLRHDHERVRQFYQQTRSYKLTMQEFGISSKGTLNHILRHAMNLKLEQTELIPIP